MSQIDKLKHSFRDCRSTFRYCDFERLLAAAGFDKIKAGGIRRQPKEVPAPDNESDDLAR